MNLKQKTEQIKKTDFTAAFLMISFGYVLENISIQNHANFHEDPSICVSFVDGRIFKCDLQKMKKMQLCVCGFRPSKFHYKRTNYFFVSQS